MKKAKEVARWLNLKPNKGKRFNMWPKEFIDMKAKNNRMKNPFYVKNN